MSEEQAAVSAGDKVDVPVYPHDVFALTGAGTAQLRGGATRLQSEALSILVLLDGKRMVGDLEQALPHLAPKAIRDALRAFQKARLISDVTMPEADRLDLDFTSFLKAPAAKAVSKGAQASAQKEAASGNAKLESDGFYVSIARVNVRAVKPDRNFRVLMIEDDEDLVALVKRLLGRSSMDVAAAATREQVLAHLRGGTKPDLILLDVSLPQLDGFDVLRRLKTHPLLKAVPVVMLTADAKPESVVKGLTSGADGYITKPFSHEALVKGVKAVLGSA